MCVKHLTHTVCWKKASKSFKLLVPMLNANNRLCTIFVLLTASQDNLEICESTSDINTVNPEGKLNDGTEKPCMYK